jgi:hypothetical protein
MELLSDAVSKMNATASRRPYFRNSFTSMSACFSGKSPARQNLRRAINFSIPAKYVDPDWHNFSCSRITPKYTFAE